MATIGTLSGAETIFQSWCQSMYEPLSSRGVEKSTLRLLNFSTSRLLDFSTSRLLLELSFRLNLGFQHHRGRPGDSTVFPHSPEVHAHESRSNKRNGEAMPDIGSKQGVGVHNRASEQGEAHIIVCGHSELRPKRPLVTQQRSGPRHIGSHRDRPKP